VFALASGDTGGSNVPGSDPDIQGRFLMAPGVTVNGPFFGNNSEYFKLSGTSQSAPLVTGAAALVKSQFPTLTNDVVLQILLDTADDTFTGYNPELHGQGILDIEAALQVDVSRYPQVGDVL
jgi:subtilisin family serine protease